jgi:hypothetical protein
MNIELYNYLILINYLYMTYGWSFLQALLTLSWLIIIEKFSISAKSSLIIGFCLLFTCMLFVIFNNTYLSRKISEIAFIFFTIAAIQYIWKDKIT